MSEYVKCDVCGHKSCMDGCCYESYGRWLAREKALVASPKEGTNG